MSKRTRYTNSEEEIEELTKGLTLLKTKHGAMYKKYATGTISFQILCPNCQKVNNISLLTLRKDYNAIKVTRCRKKACNAVLQATILETK